MFVADIEALLDNESEYEFEAVAEFDNVVDDEIVEDDVREVDSDEESVMEALASGVTDLVLPLR